MNFVEELKWRGMLHDITPGAEEELSSKMSSAYIGFDPTAPSFTIGNYVQIMILTLFQKSGHQPIFLMGGATGRIGDPSGKDKERILKSTDELDKNLKFQENQARNLLNFSEGDNKAIMVNNFDFYKDMNILDFLRDVGKTLTVNYMMSKDSVKNRLDTGLSFTEFSYQLLQANDFLHLYKTRNCKFQMGGSDQWGNITSGTEFIKRNVEGGKAFAITTPLLTKADGKKFGKSEVGNIWLDSKLTSPYKFYQFWINAADDDIVKFYKFFSLEKRPVMETRIKEANGDPNGLKKALAKELTMRVHTEKDYKSVQNVSELLFNIKADQSFLEGLNQNDFETIGYEIPCFHISKSQLRNGISIADLLAESTNILSSKGDARRAIINKAISINKTKITSYETVINESHLIHSKYIMVENGKKNKILLKAE
ncbi:MAG: tyrosine--tRNA ligase [Saprospiraceae bacterium]